MTKMIIEFEMNMPRAALELAAPSMEDAFKKMAKQQGMDADSVKIRFE